MTIGTNQKRFPFKIICTVYLFIILVAHLTTPTSAYINDIEMKSGTIKIGSWENKTVQESAYINDIEMKSGTIKIGSWEKESPKPIEETKNLKQDQPIKNQSKTVQEQPIDEKTETHQQESKSIREVADPVQQNESSTKENIQIGEVKIKENHEIIQQVGEGN